MKRFVVVAAMLLHAGFAQAQETAKGETTYEKQATKNWWVYGIKYPPGTRNNACFARREWDDGSAIEFSKDLADGELYFWMQNMGWNVTSYDPNEKNYAKMRANLYDTKGKLVGGANWDYKLMGKNRIVIPGFKDEFVNFLGQGNRLVLIPEGTMTNVEIYFDGEIKTILAKMRECIQAFPRGGVSSSRPDSSIPSLALPKDKGGI